MYNLNVYIHYKCIIIHVLYILLHIALHKKITTHPDPKGYCRLPFSCHAACVQRPFSLHQASSCAASCQDEEADGRDPSGSKGSPHLVFSRPNTQSAPLENNHPDLKNHPVIIFYQITSRREKTTAESTQWSDGEPTVLERTRATPVQAAQAEVILDLC